MTPVLVCGGGGEEEFGGGDRDRGGGRGTGGGGFHSPEYLSSVYSTVRRQRRRQRMSCNYTAILSNECQRKGGGYSQPKTCQVCMRRGMDHITCIYGLFTKKTARRKYRGRPRPNEIMGSLLAITTVEMMNLQLNSHSSSSCPSV